MTIWFMYDNHTFARVGDYTSSRAALEAKARALFAEDGCGSLFARNTKEDWDVVSLVSARQPDGRYGVSDAALTLFFDRVDEYANWEARG